MKWRYLLNGFVFLLSKCSAFRSVSQMELSSRSGSFQVAAGLRSPNRSLNPVSGAWLSTTLSRDCVRIRGGWGGGWRRVMKSRNSCRRSPLALKLRSDDEAKIRGGALPSKAAHTNTLDRFSGPVKLQVSSNWMCTCVRISHFKFRNGTSSFESGLFVYGVLHTTRQPLSVICIIQVWRPKSTTVLISRASI